MLLDLTRQIIQNQKSKNKIYRKALAEVMNLKFEISDGNKK